ncbi:MAG: hypothetical protein B7C55_12010 [Actinomycetales bacterium mxb001]|nr:MAG: hypothetical protein B7C55_12010 [Actinomycetales bacterium mxb001]
MRRERKRRVERIVERRGIKEGEVVDFLLDFYSMEHIDLWIERIKEEEREGLTVNTRAQLSVLYSYLQTLHNRIVI